MILLVQNMKRNMMENQLSWFPIFMTAFYSLLSTCRAVDGCGPEALQSCAKPLQKITNTPTEYVRSREDLEKLCPDLQAGVSCMKRYTLNCMNDKQRDHFTKLYSDTNEAVMELCQEGPYQERSTYGTIPCEMDQRLTLTEWNPFWDRCNVGENFVPKGHQPRFLLHAPCMQKVQKEFDGCSTNYTNTMREIETGKQSNQVKSICCSFQEYINCSHNSVLKTCGNDAARFAKEFLDRMSNSLIKMHCQAYTQDKCRTTSPSKNGSSGLKVGSFILPLILFITSSRYLC